MTQLFSQKFVMSQSFYPNWTKVRFFATIFADAGGGNIGSNQSFPPTQSVDGCQPNQTSQSTPTRR